MDDRRKSTKVEDVLTDSQVRHIVKKCVGESQWQLVGCGMRPASDGIAGHLADHFRLTLRVRVEDQIMTFPLFAKSVPLNNASKIKFITDNGFFIREMTMLRLIEEFEIGPKPCVVKALFISERVLVMPDLAPEGYSTCDQLKTLELRHVLVALASVARLHAAAANLETKRGLALQRRYSCMEELSGVIDEKVDSSWLRAGAKLTANIIQHLSDKYKDAIPDAETDVLRQFLAGCEDLTESGVSLNVVLHQDLWVNNIMFKYEAGEPANAILVDFQCVRYGPPAFDVMMLLYLTTSRSFREQHEAAVLSHYFEIFTGCLSIDTRLRLKGLGYDYEVFLRWGEVARRCGMVMTQRLFPYVLMDPRTGSAVFDDPATYDRLMNEDRTDVVLAHAQRCPEYGQRQLEVTEEFVERYLLQHNKGPNSSSAVSALLDL